MVGEKSVSVVTSDGDVTFGDNVGLTIPIKALMDAPASEPNTRGIVLWNAKRVVRVPDLTDVDGRPVEFTVSVYAHRSPATADEAEALTRTQTDTKARQDKRLADEAAKREREIGRAVEITESALAKGMLAAKQGPNLAEQVKDSLALASVISAAMGGSKQIGQ